MRAAVISLVLVASPVTASSSWTEDQEIIPPATAADLLARQAKRCADRGGDACDFLIDQRFPSMQRQLILYAKTFGVDRAKEKWQSCAEPAGPDADLRSLEMCIVASTSKVSQQSTMASPRWNPDGLTARQYCERLFSTPGTTSSASATLLEHCIEQEEAARRRIGK